MSIDRINVGVGAAQVRIVIDRNVCIGAGRGLGVAPEIFRLDAEGKAVAAAVDESARQKAESAAVCCPAEAISIED